MERYIRWPSRAKGEELVRGCGDTVDSAGEKDDDDDDDDENEEEEHGSSGLVAAQMTATHGCLMRSARSWLKSLEITRMLMVTMK